MTKESRRSAALPIALLALFISLGGSVYAATKIDGRAIKPKSLPGNRLKLASVPGNRLQPGALPGNRLAPGSITGTQIDAATLGQVPTAVHADNADFAHDAEVAYNAVNATTAQKVNGHSAGCDTDTRMFAGACWQLKASEAPLTAPAAAAACAARGGELPSALPLAAFSQIIVLADTNEWSRDLTNFSGVDQYAVVTVSPSGQLSTDLSTVVHRYRCVIPLVT